MSGGRVDFYGLTLKVFCKIFLIGIGIDFPTIVFESIFSTLNFIKESLGKLTTEYLLVQPVPPANCTV